jgi:competence protein ComEA
MLCAGGGLATQAEAKSTTAGVVNINTATVKELMQLPGIGQSKAQAIMAQRNKNRFQSPGDLLQVRGIGKGLFTQLAPFVRTSGPTTIRSGKASRHSSQTPKHSPPTAGGQS